MADLQNSDRAGRTSSGAPAAAGSACGGTTRITDASCLSLKQTLEVLDEATELPPFGLNLPGLEQRLKRRLGLEISQVRRLVSLPVLIRKTFSILLAPPRLVFPPLSFSPFLKNGRMNLKSYRTNEASASSVSLADAWGNILFT